MCGIDHITVSCLLPASSLPPVPCLSAPFWKANTFLKGILEIVCSDRDGVAVRRASSLIQHSFGI